MASGTNFCCISSLAQKPPVASMTPLLALMRSVPLAPSTSTPMTAPTSSRTKRVNVVSNSDSICSARALMAS